MKVFQGLLAYALGRTVEDKSVTKDLGNDIRITKETVSWYNYCLFDVITLFSRNIMIKGFFKKF